QAWLMADAIIRTLVRLYVTKRRLLEWETHAQAGSGADMRLRVFYRQMGGGVVLAAAAALLVVAFKPGAWPLGLPFAVLWLSSPVLARRISVPPQIAPS